MRKMLLMCAVVLATLCVAAGEIWVKCTTGECDYFVTIDGVRWSVLQSGTTYRLGTYVLDYSIVPWDTSGDVVVPGSLRDSSVTAIPQSAFYGCDKITSITIPSSVSWIGGYETFQSYPSSLTNFIVSANNANYCSQDGLLLSKDKTHLVSYPRAKKGEFVIPATVTIIDDDAVSCCLHEAVAIPEGVTAIGNYAFAFSEALKVIRFPQSLSSMGGFALCYCNNLSSVDFAGPPPDGVTSADIKQDAAIRYNVAYEAAWLPVIEECGWTNATPYDPTPKPEGGPYKEMVDGIEWTFMVDADLNASVGPGSSSGTAVPTSTLGVITIPTTLGGRTVTSIGNYAFSSCANLASVTIPSSVTSIGHRAFYGCSGLTSITIPSSVTSIGAIVFYGCSGLTSVAIPSSVTSIENRAFCGCSSLTAIDVDAANSAYASQDGVLFNKEKKTLIQCPGGKQGEYTIPSSVLCIGFEAFSECFGLTSVIIPSGVMSIDVWAFRSCTSLTSITIPSSVTSIENQAFCECISLTAIDVDAANSAYASQDGVLFNKGKSTLIMCPCGKKGSYTIPSSVTDFEDSAFSGCSGLTSVTIPWGVIRIGPGVFSGCSGLTSVSIPSTVTGIWNTAFRGCSSLTAINVDAYNSVYASQDGVLFNKGKTTLVMYPCGKQGSYTIPSGVTSIGNDAFYGCSGLTSVTISEGVTSIGGGAFYGCTSLTSVTIPSSVTSIGYGWHDLNAVDFEGAPPSGVTDAGIKKDAAIRYNIAYRDEWEPVIEQCGWTNAKPYLYPAGGPYKETVDGIEWTFMVDGNLNANVGADDRCAVPKTTMGAITIPSVLGGRSVTGMERGAFQYRVGLTSVTIPEGVRYINVNAFVGCSGMMSVSIPSSVKWIEGYAFSGCSGLTRVTIPSGVESIGERAFLDCTSLTSVSIPSSVTSIGTWAFYGCSGLGEGVVVVDGCAFPVSDSSPATIEFPEGTRLIADFCVYGNINLTSVTMSDGMAIIGKYAFYGCGLTSVSIPQSVKRIGMYAFACGLGEGIVIVDDCVLNVNGPCPADVDIPDGTRLIADYVFAHHDEIKSIAIPGSVATISDQMCDGCEGLTNVTMASGVTTIGRLAFWNCDGLTSVTIPSSVTSIGDNAFGDCRELNSVDFEGAPPDGVKWAGFKQDAAIRYNVDYYEQWLPVIEQCGWTNATPYDPTPKPEGGPYKETVAGIEWTFMVDGNLEACVGTWSYEGTAVPQTTQGDIAIPMMLGGRAVTTVSDYAFYNCGDLTSVTIPLGVTSIWNLAFGCCSASVTIPESVTFIGRAFNNFSWATVDFKGIPPTGVTSANINPDAAIRYNGMYYAQWEPVVKQCGWTNANPYAPYPFPEGGPYKEAVEGVEWTFMVTNGEACVGTGSSSGTAIPAATTGEIAIPTELGGHAVTSIGQEAFYCCKAITGATIPSSITSIGKSAFGKCIKLEGVMIPASVTNIGICAFSGDCESLKWIDVEAESAYYSAQDGVLFNKDKTALIQYPGAKAGTYTIPESVKHIGPWAFQWCHNLERLTVPTNVVSMAESAFFTGVYTFAIDFEGAPPKGIRDAFINSASPIRYNIAYRGEWEQVAKDCQWSNAKPYYPVPLPEGGPYKEKIEGIEWTFFVTNGEACVGTGKAAAAIPTTTKGAIRVPAELGGRPVTRVGNSAFSMCSDLTGVTIPEGVTSLGTSLFYCDFKITELTVPASVTNIAEGAFYACVNLQGINVADGNQHYVSIDGVVYTKDGTSMLCCVPTKTSVSILASVTNICSLAFGDCRQLESITLPPNLTTLGHNVFYSCKITELTFPSSLVRIGGNLFPGCSLLTTFYFKGAPPERIEYGGFKTDATIRYNGMYYAQWEPVVKACGWTNAKPYAPVPFPEGGPYKETVDGIEWTFMVGPNLDAVLGTGLGGDRSRTIKQSTEGDVTIPETLGQRVVTAVGLDAFFQCFRLTSVMIPDSVTVIEQGGFANCAMITNMIIPQTVVSIGKAAFYSCTALDRITVPSSVTNIGDNAFASCSGLHMVDFEGTAPSGVVDAGLDKNTAIRYNGMYYTEWEAVVKACGWTNAKSYAPYPFPEGGPYKLFVDSVEWTFLIEDGVVTIGSWDPELHAVPTTTQGAITVPQSLCGRTVEIVQQWAFMDCTELTNIILPDSITAIGAQAFRGCTKLKSMRIPEGVASIGWLTFAWCSALTEVTIPDSVTTIGNWAFYFCKSLPRVTIPEKVTSIGEYAFSGCQTLAHLTIPASVTSISADAFFASYNLNSLEFQGAPPEGVGSAGIKTDAAIKYSGQCFNAWERVIEQCGWTNTTPYNPSGEPYPDGGLYAEMAGGLRWLFMVRNAEASLGSGSTYSGRPTISPETTGDIVIPNSLGGRSVTDLSSAAFVLCSNLTSVTISAIVTNVEACAFNYCCSIQTIDVAPDNAFLTTLDGVLFDKSVKNLIAFPAGLSGEYTIPSSVTNVYSCAFYLCRGLTKITLPMSVSSVGVWAIGNCINLNAVDFECAPPKGVEYLAINSDAAIRYNAAYQAEWEPVVEACGWTNAKPYYPFAPATPVISPESGTTFEGSSLSVSMTCASEEATIHYTTDGSEPTMESPVYRRFKVYGKTTVKAIAFFEDGTPSEMAVAEYAKGVCDNPEIAPPDGTVFEHSGQKVSITRYAEDGVVRYTTDGGDPTEDSPAYAEPFTIDETTTIRAKVFGDQYFDSGVVTATLTRVWVKVATPVITAPTSFTGSQQKIEISCATEGATVRYTTNGQDPNSHSPKYTKPFYVTDTTTVKAYATKADYVKSDIAACTIAKVWGIGDTMGKPDHAFSTGGDLGFVRVEDATATLGESMQSGEIKNSQTSILSTVVVGPGTLTFKWKTSCEHDPEGSFEWDHAEFLVDGKIKGQLDDETEWIEVSQRIEGDGEHTVIWLYVKDDVEEGGEDCLWVSDYVWETDYTETKTTEVPVPYDWLQEKSRDIVDEYDNYEKVAKQKAYNPRYTVEQCYVAGLDPESTTNEFKMAISMEGGFPKITWTPDLGVLREYKVWGRESLMSGDWQYPTNSTHRFFKVTVEMK